METRWRKQDMASGCVDRNESSEAAARKKLVLWTVIHFDITNTEQFNLFQFRLLLYILSAVELIHFTPEFIDTLQKNVQKWLSGQFEP